MRWSTWTAHGPNHCTHRGSDRWVSRIYTVTARNFWIKKMMEKYELHSIRRYCPIVVSYYFYFYDLILMIHNFFFFFLQFTICFSPILYPILRSTSAAKPKCRNRALEQFINMYLFFHKHERCTPFSTHERDCIWTKAIVVFRPATRSKHNKIRCVSHVQRNS